MDLASVVADGSSTANVTSLKDWFIPNFKNLSEIKRYYMAKRGESLSQGTHHHLQYVNPLCFDSQSVYEATGGRHLVNIIYDVELERASTLYDLA